MTDILRDDTALHDPALHQATVTTVLRRPTVQAAQPDASQPGGAPSASGPSPIERLRKRRRTVVLAVVGLVCLAILDLLLGSMMHQQRQQHLAVAFTEPKAKLVPGDALMTLQIPSLEINQTVVEGAMSAQLAAGPGHVLNTSIPGAPGNTVILGHATRFGGPFGEIGSLEKGAKIAVKTRNGLVRIYDVKSVKKVKPSNNSALEQTKGEQLTLVTSSGGLWPGSRVVVRATPKDKADATAIKIKTPRYHPAKDGLDQSSVSWLALLGLVLLGLAIGFGRRALAARYQPATVIAVLAPLVGLTAVLALSLLGIIGPSTW